MRITHDAIEKLGEEKLRKAAENAKTEGRKTIRAEDLP